MFCSFAASPRIMRFFCTGKVVEWDQPEFEPLLRKMGKKKIEGARAVILLDVFKVQTSCGFGVPMLAGGPMPEGGEPEKVPMPELKDRATLGHWASNKIRKGELQQYQAASNAHNLDGFGGMRAAARDRGERLWLVRRKDQVRRIAGQSEAVIVGLVMGVALLLWAQLLAQRLGVRLNP